MFPDRPRRCSQSGKYTTQTIKSAGSSLIAHLLETDYGHSATALLGITVLGILLAFPTLMF